MNERDEHLERLAELKLGEREARREHYSIIALGALSSSVVFSSVPTAALTDAPPWLVGIMAAASTFLSTFAIREMETTIRDLNEAKKKVADYEARIDIKRLRS